MEVFFLPKKHPGCKGKKKKNVNESPRNRESYSAAAEFFFCADFAWVILFQHGSAPWAGSAVKMNTFGGGDRDNSAPTPSKSLKF